MHRAQKASDVTPQKIADEIYYSLGDFEVAGACLKQDSQVLKDTTLTYPLNYLLQQQQLPAAARTLGLSEDMPRAIANITDTRVPVRSIDMRCLNYDTYFSAERPELQQYYQSLSVTSKIYLMGVLWKIHADYQARFQNELEPWMIKLGNISRTSGTIHAKKLTLNSIKDVEMRQEIEAIMARNNCTAQKALAVMLDETTNKINTIKNKYEKVFEQAIDLLSPKGLDDAFQHAREARPAFVAYVEALTKLEAVPAGSKDERVFLQGLLDPVHMTIQALSKQDLPPELQEFAYHKATVMCERALQKIATLSPEDQITVDLIERAMLSLAEIMKVSDLRDIPPADFDQLCKNINEAMNNVFLPDLQRFITPLLQDTLRNLLLDDKLLERIFALNDSEFSRLQTKSDGKLAHHNIMILATNIADMRAAEIWKSTLGDIDPAEISLRDATNIFHHVQAELRRKLILMKEDGKDIKGRAKEEVVNQATFDQILKNPKMTERDKKQAILNLARTINGLPVVEHSNSETFRYKSDDRELHLFHELAMDRVDSFNLNAINKLLNFLVANKFPQEIINTVQFERLCVMTVQDNKIDPQQKKELIALLVRNFKPYESVSINIFGCDLSGQVLNGISRPNSNMQSVNLIRATLKDSSLPHVNLYKSGLKETKVINCDMHHANLAKSDVLQAEFFNTNLSHAVLAGSRFTFAKLTSVNLAHADMQHLIAANAEFSDVTLDHANLTYANLAGSKFNDVTLKGAILDGANLINADLGNISFTGVSMRETKLIAPHLKKDAMEWHETLSSWQAHKVPLATAFFNVLTNLRDKSTNYTVDELNALLAVVEAHPYFNLTKAPSRALYHAPGAKELSQFKDDIRSLLEIAATFKPTTPPSPRSK